MYCVQLLKQLLVRRRQRIRQSILAHPCRVPSNRGMLLHSQHRVAGRVDLEEVSACQPALGLGRVNAVFAVVSVRAFDSDVFSIFLGGMFF
jgi:hypothetical protein